MAGNKLFQRPLYVFDLPEEILNTLQVKTTGSDTTTHEHSQSKTPVTQNESQSLPSATACNLCDLSFGSVPEQRAHVRSDLHRYNLKQKLLDRKPVHEKDFEKLVEDLDESISGSDSEGSSTDEDETGKRDTLSTLLKRQARVDDDDANDHIDSARSKHRSSGRPPLYWFKSSLLPSNTSLGIYRNVFTTTEQEEELHLVESLRSKQISRTKGSVKIASSKDEDNEPGGVPLPGSTGQPVIQSSGPHYFLCMIGGGHFAAMLVSLTPKITKKAGVEDRTATVLAHKTFHRYTTRRKQGGAQSANDNAKGNAHSAGAGIRRYNEAALEQDVRNLLSDWRPWINSADLLFIRATGTTNRRTLFGPYDGQVLSQKDSRLRGFPFNTRRATQNELMRAFIELTRVKISSVDEAALAQKAREEEAKRQQDSQRAADKDSRVKVGVAKPSKEQEEAAQHTTQLQALIKRSKAPALASYYQTNSLPLGFAFSPHNHHAPTPLHFAASNNAAACVTALLVKVGVDPTVLNGEGRTACELAGDRPTRDMFSLARGQVGEDKWDWAAARVPSALSQAEVGARAEQERKEKASADNAEKSRRQAEVARLRQEDEQRQDIAKDRKYGIGKTLAAAPMTAEQRRAEDAKGMTDEMRLRLERERRARAAEERIRRLQNGS